MVVKIEKERESEHKFKNFLDWLWNSESILSYLAFLVIVFVLIKFIFLPGLGLLFGTSLPLAIVESSSMEHYSLLTPGLPGNTICGKEFSDSKFLNKDEYWQACGEWYEQNANISKEQFNSFKLSNGFRKGDLIIIFGVKNVKVGDVIIFNGGRSNPIIHRVISLNPIQTKGDHNQAQLNEEKNISQDQIIGKAVAKIPYIGWIKLFFVEIMNKLRG